jgi:hypothetical protein
MGRFRVDVAALLPGSVAEPGWLISGLFAPTMLVECKASRPDFLCCTKRATALRLRRDRLRRRRAEHDAEFAAAATGPAAINPDDPSLVPLPARPHQARATIDLALSRLERRLYAGAKFDLFVRYRLADRLLLVTSPGVIDRTEVPRGWGWAESDGLSLHLHIEPPALQSSARWRSAIHRAANRSLPITSATTT